MSLFNKQLLKFLILIGFTSHLSAAPNKPPECVGIPLQAEFASGVGWSMCLSLDDEEGLSIHQLKHRSSGQERRVLGKASLSQLEIVFDDNTQPPSFAVTRGGLGGDKLLKLSPKDCIDGQLYPEASEQRRNLLCARTQDAGLLYRYGYQAQRQGAFFEVFSISQATASQTYTQRWRFYETGVIEPAIGFSGKMPRFAPAHLGFGRAIADADEWALGFSAYLGWRLDFDLGKDANNDIAEEINSRPSASRRHKSLSTEVLSAETARSLNPELKTSWRIKDADERNEFGQAISYELVPSQYHQSNGDVRGRPWLKHDVYFTRYQECEQHASDNPPDTGCARNVLQASQDQEPLERTDLVLWYKQNYHYLPRSDDSDYLSTDWVSFQLVPRDWTTGNPL